MIESEKARDIHRVGTGWREAAPVFVVGCPRSGTTLLYHMILSAGNFAIYRGESNVFNLLFPRFGGLRREGDRKALLDVWFKSNLFRVSGVDPVEFRAKILKECRNGGDFLRILMCEIAERQGVTRWADCTPEHLLYMDAIKREIPDALFVQIIRDGRDVALSYAKQGWSHPLPWDRDKKVAVAGLYWEWLVRKGQELGKRLGHDYMEVRFEDLVEQPQATLSSIGSFIDHELDYERIRRAGIGSVSEPNSSFRGDADGIFNPVARWKTKMSPKEIADFEYLVGDFLAKLGYDRLPRSGRRLRFEGTRLRATYRPIFEAKHWARTNTRLGRFVQLERIEIEA